jgi:hypothetical protein
LATKAIREGWAVPLRTKKALIAEGVRLMRDQTTHDRLLIAVARFIVAANAASLEAEARARQHVVDAERRQ